MSPLEKHHESTIRKDENLNLKIAQLIAAALRADYGEKYSSIKMIARHCDASLSTIKKWYEGQNPPNSKHLIMLARKSPSVLKALLGLIEIPSLWQAYQDELSARNEPDFNAEKAPIPDIYTAKYCGINLMADSVIAGQFNPRQLWFLGCVQQEMKVKAEDIIKMYDVSPRSAQTDVAGLIRAKLIRFVGSKKKGWYEATNKVLR